MPTSPYDPFAPKRIPPPTNLGVPQDRTPYTGTFGETPQAPAQTPPPSQGQSQLGSMPNGTYGGYMGPAPAYAGDAPGSNSNAQVNQDAAAAAAASQQSAPSWGLGYNPITTLGGNPASSVGDPARATAQQLQLQAYGVSQRGAPQINAGAQNMFAQGTGNALTNANQTNLLGVRQGLDMANLANGQGVQGQFGAANALMGMSQMPAGPSVAEQQLRMGGDQAMRQQMAMAAGARGGNAALALQNAGQNQGDIMGNLNGQLGVQRAQEDMANRQFAANAAQGAGNMYGQAAGTQGNALSGAGNIFGNVANNQLGQANTNANLTGIYAQTAADQARIQGGQNQLNDQTMMQSQAMAQAALESQRQAEMGQYSNELGLANQRYGIDRGANTQLQLQANQQSNDWWKDVVKGLSTAAGTVGGFFAGGPAGAVAGGTGAYKLSDSAVNSDIRAKKDIKPAGDEISNAFRSADETANHIMGMPVSYPQLNAPGYSYGYKQPYSPGSAPGTQYGPMAQDLEKTPAGASVVHEVNGKKAVDPGRLAMLTASETAKQRRELDELKAGLFGGASGRAPMATQLTNPGSDFSRFGAPDQVSGYQPQHGPIMQNGPMRVMGMGPDGRPIMAPQQMPSSGPSIGFGQGDMGYNPGGPPPAPPVRRDPRFGLGYTGM